MKINEKVEELVILLKQMDDANTTLNTLNKKIRTTSDRAKSGLPQFGTKWNTVFKLEDDYRFMIMYRPGNNYSNQAFWFYTIRRSVKEYGSGKYKWIKVFRDKKYLDPPELSKFLDIWGDNLIAQIEKRLRRPHAYKNTEKLKQVLSVFKSLMDSSKDIDITVKRKDGISYISI